MDPGASLVPPLRRRAANRAAIRPDGRFVLYWMTAARRLRFNFALDRALELAAGLGRPLVILEALRCDYPWASDRLHAFVVDGMAANAARAASTGATYVPWVEPSPGAGHGLLAALGAEACAVVGDEYPCFFLPRMVARAAELLPVRLEVVDSNGLLPLRASERSFPTAHGFRRFLQRELPGHLDDFPAPDPLAGALLPPLAALPRAVTANWPPTPEVVLRDPAALLRSLPIDHTVAPTPTRGGTAAALARLERFLGTDLARYAESRNDPDDDCSSGLAAHLHFGHISAHEVLAALGRHEGWTPATLCAGGAGKRRGWWGMSEAAEAFLDQLVTWRELGYNFAATRDDIDRFDSLPAWARLTLARHAGDRRPFLYSLEEFRAAATHDPLWNAAQRQLLRDGRIHTYLRMLWGKKILEWSASPEEALAVLIELNNRHALDGRDPNSYSGIFWCLGRHDRAWGPEREVFGTVRYMSSRNTARKVSVRAYLARYGETAGPSDAPGPVVRGIRPTAGRGRRSGRLA